MPIRIFLLSNFMLLLHSLTDMIKAQPAVLNLVGSAYTLERAAEAVVSSGAQVLLLDIDGDEEAAQVLPLITSLLTGQQIKILLLSRHHNDELLHQAIRHGARGLIDHTTTLERLILAVQKVQEGHIWLDRDATSRFFDAYSREIAEPSLSEWQTQSASLSVREKSIVNAIAQHSGDSGKVIASLLFISESTLRCHLTSIYRKLGVKNYNGLLTFALHHGQPPHFNA